jgi:hypothetical protein
MVTDTNKNREVGKRDASGRRDEPLTSYAGRLEDYTPERIAEFLLNNAVGPEDYATAVEEVRKLGIDPATIPHTPPAGT